MPIERSFRDVFMCSLIIETWFETDSNKKKKTAQPPFPPHYGPGFPKVVFSILKSLKIRRRNVKRQGIMRFNADKLKIIIVQKLKTSINDLYFEIFNFISGVT